MKNEKGITLLALAVTMVIIAIIGFTVFYTAEGLDEGVDDDVLLAELQTVHHIVLQEYNKKLTLGDEYEYKGTIYNGTIASIFDGTELYILSAEDLKSIGAKNVSSTYLVCYDTGEVANVDNNGESIRMSGDKQLYTK